VVKACIEGNQQAQRILFRQFFGYAKSICLRYSSSQEEAEDLLNEGFLKVFQHLDKYDHSLPFRAWLRTILINTAISHYRKHQRRYQETVSLEDAVYTKFEESVLDKITAEEILQLVQTLPPMYRNVFLLYAVDGYSHREIAEMLSLNEATVRSHYVRSRAKLQQMIKYHYPDLFPRDWGLQSYTHHES
jgi:RNA polymerase sigma-70 factor (ECF subfamily)